MKYGRERMHMSNEAPLLEVRNLTKHFPVGHGKEVHAVNGVSFTLEKGETLGIVGESGCGKSSMGRTILKVHEPTSGQIIFEGNDITNLSPMPGLQELFQWMKERNLKAGLVTSTSAKYIITALNRIKMTDYFSVIVCGDMCEKRKPYPDGYLKAIQLLQAEKDEVVAIEDSSTGIHAAIQAGIDVIGYTGSGIKQDTGEATAVFSSFQDIQHFLETAIL
mgnify:CR=1 FL=1